MNKNLLDIEVIRGFVTKRKVDWTIHCLNRLNQRNISILDVKNAIQNGRIIEYYYDDYPDTNYWEKDMKTRRER